VGAMRSDLDRIISTYGMPDFHLASDAPEAPWLPFGDGLTMRHLAFDVRTNTYVNIMKAERSGRLNRHRHRGPVHGFVQSGSWRYLEYDWVARPGSYIHESPGVIHTLVAEEPMETFFIVNGAVEFFDDNDEIVAVEDVFTVIDAYVAYCSDNKLEVNERLFI